MTYFPIDMSTTHSMIIQTLGRHAPLVTIKLLVTVYTRVVPLPREEKYWSTLIKLCYQLTTFLAS